jgi:hypothetical protein
MADTTPSPPSGALPGGRPGAVSPAEQREDRSRGEPAAGDATALAMDLGTELLGAVRDSAAALVDEQRNRVANEIDAFSEVLRGSVQSLDRSGGKAVARYTDDAARHIGHFAERLRCRSVAGLTADLEDVARRWPLPFIASAIGVGLIAGRFIVSSGPRPQNPSATQTTQSFPRQPVDGDKEPAGDARDDCSAVGGRVFGSTKTGSPADSA